MSVLDRRGGREPRSTTPSSERDEAHEDPTKVELIAKASASAMRTGCMAPNMASVMPFPPLDDVLRPTTERILGWGRTGELRAGRDYVAARIAGSRRPDAYGLRCSDDQFVAIDRRFRDGARGAHRRRNRRITGHRCLSGSAAAATGIPPTTSDRTATDAVHEPGNLGVPRRYAVRVDGIVAADSSGARPPDPIHVADGSEPEVRRLSRSEEHTSELQSRLHLVCRLLL